MVYNLTMKLLILLISVLSCQKEFNVLKNVRFFEANFKQVVKTGDYVYRDFEGHLWFSKGKVKINITSPDTEFVLIDDSTVKTLNFKDSTLVIQKKLKDVDFFFNMMLNPTKILPSDGDCVAVFAPDSGNVDSMKVFFRGKIIKKVIIYQDEIVVVTEIRAFKTLAGIPDTVFTLPRVAGFQIIRF